MSFLQLVSPEDRQTVTRNHPATVSFRAENKYGIDLFVELNAAPITLDGGTASLNILRDITEKIKLETQLRQAREMEFVGTLAGGVAHDLNNILTGIISYPELMLLHLEADSPLRKPLLSIKKAGTRRIAPYPGSSFLIPELYPENTFYLIRVCYFCFFSLFVLFIILRYRCHEHR